MKFHRTCLFYKLRGSTQKWCHKFNCPIICDDVKPEDYGCWVRLAPRELETLRLMPNHSGRGIAHKLGIARSTVYEHQHSIRKKFGLVGEGKLKTVLLGIELGLIDLKEVKFLRVRKDGEVWV